MNSTTAEIFNKHGYLHAKEFISKEMCAFLSHALLLHSDNSEGHVDPQVPTAKTVLTNSLIFDTLLEKLWPDVELLVGEPLIPSYSYARLYSNGDELKEHTDREACEVSLTLQLGRSHHYSWPLYMNGVRFDLNEGDGVLYKGIELPHWRKVCDGPEGYYSGQVFLHYVRANGPNAHHALDAFRKNQNAQQIVTYKKYRPFLMEEK
jgi:hypothetical protein